MFKQKRSAEDFAEELQAHIELEVEELRREGMSEEEARRQARRKFGGPIGVSVDDPAAAWDGHGE